jgi:hypothetical protein
MIYVKWILMLPVNILVTVLAIVLSPVLPLFAVEREGWQNNGATWGMGWYLPKWLNWFQTPDNSLDGDEGWKTEHWQWRYKLPTKICTYVGRFGWLLRNPGQGYGVEYLVGNPIVGTYTGNLAVNDSPGVEGQCMIHVQDLFQWVWVRKIGNGNKCVYFNFGWNIKGCIHNDQYSHTATYTFSPRISTFK